MTNFVQFAHGLLVDAENFGRRHSHPLDSFNPHPDELPGGDQATPSPITMAAPTGQSALTGSPQNTALPVLEDAEVTPPGVGDVTHTPAGEPAPEVAAQPAVSKTFSNVNPHADDSKE